MKNLKKVLAFTLALAMLLSTMTTTFAASKEVEALATMKLLLNTSDAEVNQELSRAIGLAMVLKALGYSQADANAKMMDNKFVDMEGSSWAKGYAALAEELKISNGTSVEPKLFSPMQKLDEKSFVTFMLRALGYDSDKAWAEAGTLAKEAGLVAGELTNMNFRKGDAAVIMYNALLAKVQGDKEGRTLAQKLVAENKLDKDLAVAGGVIAAEPEKLMVAEAKADNLKEVMVMFNGTVDKKSAENVGNYKLKGKNLDTAKLMDDMKTVVLTLKGDLPGTAMTNKKEVKLTVKNVKNAAGVAMKKQEINFTPSDTEYPTVKEVVFTGPKSLEITFSEPMEAPGKVTLMAGKSRYTSSTKISEANNRVVEVSLYTTLKNETDYMVAVGDPKISGYYAHDFAGYPNVYYEASHKYVADTTAPEAKVVEANQKVVTVEFNKPVKGVTPNHFYHSVAGYKAMAVYKDSDMKKLVSKSDAVSKVWVKFYNNDNKHDAKNHPLPAGNVQFVILGEDSSKSKIVDNWKNQFATATIEVAITADREAPEVVSAEVTDEKEIKVTFNEKISNLERKHFTLLDKDGKEIEKGSKMKLNTEDGNKVAVLKLSDAHAGKTVTLNIKGLKDDSLFENMMSDYTTTFDFVDKSWKGIKSVDYRKDHIQGTDGTKNEHFRFLLFVTFDEDMDDSATDLANYKFFRNDKTVSVKGTADFYEGKNNIVQIELSRDNDNSKDTDAKFLANNGASVLANTYLLVNDKVKDAAGNGSSNFQTKVEIKDFNGANRPKIDKVEAVETKKVVVKFDKELTNIDSSKFEIKAGATVYTKDANYNFVDGKTLEIFLADNMPVGTGDFGGIRLHFADNKETVDIYGRWLEATPTAGLELTDKIAPAIASFTYKDATGVSNATGTAAYMAMNGETKQNDLDGKPIIKVEYVANPSVDALVGGSSEVSVTVRAHVTLKYTETISNASLSTTTYTVDNGYKVVAPSVLASGREVQVVVEKTYKTKKNASQLKEEIMDNLNDLTITQVGAVKDMVSPNANVMSGNSNAMDILDVNSL